MVKALDEDFTILTFSPAFTTTRFKKGDFPIHAFELADCAHVLVKDLHRMSVSSKPITVFS